MGRQFVCDLVRDAFEDMEKALEMALRESSTWLEKLDLHSENK